eukprot:7289157-Pyramimonas_sp.AAC.1
MPSQQAGKHERRQRKPPSVRASGNQALAMQACRTSLGNVKNCFSDTKLCQLTVKARVPLHSPSWPCPARSAGAITMNGSSQSRMHRPIHQTSRL